MWSIPACAGEPYPPAVVCNDEPVYPRVCGGTAAVSMSSNTHYGLSPRVRGNHGERLLRCELLMGLSPRVRGNQRPLLDTVEDT